MRESEGNPYSGYLCWSREVVVEAGAPQGPVTRFMADLGLLSVCVTVY